MITRSAKRVLLGTVCLVCVYLITVSISLQKVEPPHVLGTTITDANPVYRQWKFQDANFSEVHTDHICGEYFHTLSSIFTPAKIGNIDHLAYDRDRWLRQHIRDHKFVHGVEGDFRGEIFRQFDMVAAEMAIIEKDLVSSIGHQRAWGHCALSHTLEDVQHDLSKYGKIANFDTVLFPWLSGAYPRFNDFERGLPVTDGNKPKLLALDEGFIQTYLRQLNGKGIVVYVNETTAPLVPSLVTALRMHQNELPIQVVAFDNIVDRNATMMAAKDNDVLNDAFLEYLKLENLPKPKLFLAQNVTYVDLNPAVVNPDKLKRLIRELAGIFNSFEEFLLISPLVIPLVPPATFFELEGYKDTGMALFKLPQYLDRPTRPPIGTAHITNLIHQLMPTAEDVTVFDINDDNFQDIDLDPHLAVLNKNNVLSGLLITVNLNHHPLMEIAVQDLFWTGQQILGVFTHVNVHPAVAMGTVSDKSHKSEVAANSDELCSLLWGQFAMEGDPQVYYVTAHELINWHSDQQFRLDVQTRTGSTHAMKIENVLKPVSINEKIGYEFVNGEPDQPWIRQEMDSGAYPYWCAYNILGDATGVIRGVIIPITKIRKARYRYLVTGYASLLT